MTVFYDTDTFTVEGLDESGGKILVKVVRKPTQRNATCVFSAVISLTDFATSQRSSIYDRIRKGSKIFRGNGYFYIL